MKNNKGVMTLIHVVIGIAITLLVANLTPPEPLTRYGLTVIGLFVVTNYWFAHHRHDLAQRSVPCAVCNTYRHSGG